MDESSLAAIFFHNLVDSKEEVTGGSRKLLLKMKPPIERLMPWDEFTFLISSGGKGISQA